nr:immunoglobulin light chain junction region [Macaca mulatta]MOX71003.1 immunoglobulin light chain junction region [Macaca mulatta]MOX71322.1 immunoglobulin light chain junction region [Macaca mulatta]MOX71482.1 immunoglobulin light chain junction region [Macaca mulatta]MOX74752.1 immunoglobulin light chain junction region [Macaca mulatta]
DYYCQSYDGRSSAVLF